MNKNNFADATSSNRQASISIEDTDKYFLVTFHAFRLIGGCHLSHTIDTLLAKQRATSRSRRLTQRLFHEVRTFFAQNVGTAYGLFPGSNIFLVNRGGVTTVFLVLHLYADGSIEYRQLKKTSYTEGIVHFWMVSAIEEQHKNGKHRNSVIS